VRKLIEVDFHDELAAEDVLTELREMSLVRTVRLVEPHPEAMKKARECATELKERADDGHEGLRDERLASAHMIEGLVALVAAGAKGDESGD